MAKEKKVVNGSWLASSTEFDAKSRYLCYIAQGLALLLLEYFFFPV